MLGSKPCMDGIGKDPSMFYRSRDFPELQSYDLEGMELFDYQILGSGLDS